MTNETTAAPASDPQSDLTQDELLDLLIEECSEVIQAASKCKRFGFDRDHPVYGMNSTVLAMECGDIFGVVDALKLNTGVMERERGTKIERARAAKRQFGRGQ